MKTLTIKNIPDDVYQKLKESAEANHRRIGDEVIAILEKAFLPKPLDVEAWLEKARQIRQLTAGYRATAEEIEEAINEGR